MIVIGCGKAKLDHAATAGELYIGSLFRAAKRYAEAWEHPWCILSGKHGVLWPLEVVEPYEQRVALKGPALERWANEAARELREARDGGRLGEQWVVAELLMGRQYAEPLGRALDALGVSWCAPLDGFGLGHRLQWLTGRAQFARRELARKERERAGRTKRRGAA